jgi:hypothetical protein
MIRGGFWTPKIESLANLPTGRGTFAHVVPLFDEPQDLGLYFGKRR